MKRRINSFATWWCFGFCLIPQPIKFWKQRGERRCFFFFLSRPTPLSPLGRLPLRLLWFPDWDRPAFIIDFCSPSPCGSPSIFHLVSHSPFRIVFYFSWETKRGFCVSLWNIHLLGRRRRWRELVRDSRPHQTFLLLHFRRQQAGESILHFVGLDVTSAPSDQTFSIDLFVQFRAQRGEGEKVKRISKRTAINHPLRLTKSPFSSLLLSWSAVLGSSCCCSDATL